MTTTFASRLLALGSAVLIGLPVAGTDNARADTYSFKGGHTTITVSWVHAGLSRHYGRIVGARGSLVFDPAKPEESRLEVTIDPSGLSTGVPALDRLLRGPDFFDVANQPPITFRSTSVRAGGERIGEVVGDLAIRGTMKSAALAVKWNFSGEHPLGLVNPGFAGQFVSGFSATARIVRSDWGLGRGTPLISDDVDIAIETELVRQ